MALPFDVVVSCEHASNAVPPGFDLGVPPEVLDTHAAWDPGAPPVAELLAQALGAPLFVGKWTRLLADLNRSPENPASVPEVAFDVPVPANQGLTEAERAARLERYHAPYWAAVSRRVEAVLAQDPQVKLLHLSVHSFTGEFRGEIRPMSLGVMFDPARRLERHVADVLLEDLNRQGVHAVENEPYDGRHDALCTALRGSFSEDRYAGLIIELSQNHLDEIDALGLRLLAAIEQLEKVG